ncbi:hypothetical protein Sjap_021245 [Stephania japonica]|uniref:Uncharacterized protein n=1 Tax=Stephania japonica TaxID=461633 RepID=A0AAP0ES82_9MAGN
MEEVGNGNNGGIERFLRERGVDEKSINDMLCRCKRLRGVEAERAAQNWSYFNTTLGIPHRKLPSLLLKCPKLLALDLHRQIIPTAHCLLALASKPSHLTSAITKFPHILSHSVQHKLCPLLAFLESLGVPNTKVGKILLLNPRLISYSIHSKLTPVVDFLSTIGLYKDGMIAALLLKGLALNFPQVLCRDVDKVLRPNFAFLKDSGFRDAQVVALVTAYPPILIKSIRNSLAPRIKFLVEVMGRHIDEVVEYPDFFRHGLKKRLESRHRLLKQNNIVCSLSEMLDGNHNKFASKFGFIKSDEGTGYGLTGTAKQFHYQAHSACRELLYLDFGISSDDGSWVGSVPYDYFREAATRTPIEALLNGKTLTTIVFFLDETFEEIAYDMSTTVADAVEEFAGIIKLSAYSSFSLSECCKVVAGSKSPELGNGNLSKDEARQQFLQILRDLPYGNSVFFSGRKIDDPIGFLPGRIMLGINKRGLIKQLRDIMQFGSSNTAVFFKMRRKFFQGHPSVEEMIVKRDRLLGITANDSGNSTMASYSYNYGRFEDSYYHGVNGVADIYESMRNQPSRDIIRFLLESEQDMDLTEKELDQWIEQKDQEAEEEMKSILQNISAEIVSAIPLKSVKVIGVTPVEDYYSETTQELEVFLSVVDIIIAKDEEEENEMKIEVPNELPILKEGMHASLPKAEDAPFIVDILKGEGIM